MPRSIRSDAVDTSPGRTTANASNRAGDGRRRRNPERQRDLARDEAAARTLAHPKVGSYENGYIRFDMHPDFVVEFSKFKYNYPEGGPGSYEYQDGMGYPTSRAAAGPWEDAAVAAENSWWGSP